MDGAVRLRVSGGPAVAARRRHGGAPVGRARLLVAGRRVPHAQRQVSASQ